MLSCLTENAPPTARYDPLGVNATALMESPPAKDMAPPIGVGDAAGGLAQNRTAPVLSPVASSDPSGENCREYVTADVVLAGSVAGFAVNPVAVNARSGAVP